MADIHKILLLNGPNLNMLGRREPDIYGTQTLDDIRDACEQKAKTLGFELDFRQSNREGELVDWIQEAKDAHDGIIINPAAYTHSSVAILDALVLTDLPVIEIHLSNIFRREPFRAHSYISMGASGVICGFGSNSYTLALDAMSAILHQGETT